MRALEVRHRGDARKGVAAVMLRLPEALRDRLTAEARAEGLSRNALIVRLLAGHYVPQEKDT